MEEHIQEKEDNQLTQFIYAGVIGSIREHCSVGVGDGSDELVTAAAMDGAHAAPLHVAPCPRRGSGNGDGVGTLDVAHIEEEALAQTSNKEVRKLLGLDGSSYRQPIQILLYRYHMLVVWISSIFELTTV